MSPHITVCRLTNRCVIEAEIDCLFADPDKIQEKITELTKTRSNPDGTFLHSSGVHYGLVVYVGGLTQCVQENIQKLFKIFQITPGGKIPDTEHRCGSNFPKFITIHCENPEKSHEITRQFYKFAFNSDMWCPITFVFGCERDSQIIAATQTANNLPGKHESKIIGIQRSRLVPLMIDIDHNVNESCLDINSLSGNFEIRGLVTDEDDRYHLPEAGYQVIREYA